VSETAISETSDAGAPPASNVDAGAPPAADAGVTDGG
jgi:hypothetical protein